MSLDATRNLVYRRLPEGAQRAIVSSGEFMPLKQGTLLHRFGDPATHCIFPLSGMVSLTVSTPAGDNVEVALVGREGVVGVGTLLHNPTADLEAIAQVEGEAVAVPIETIGPALRDALLGPIARYATALIVELAQTAACNRLHSVEERTARWLLHAADRSQTSDLKLTHEFLAMMLGVRRASVTVVVGGFQAAELIVAERRRISLADRDGLREHACSCYEVLRDALAPYEAGDSALPA